MDQKKRLDLLETEAERFPGCHFFTGISNDTCGAGVKNDEVTVHHAPINGFIGSKPCLPTYAQVPVSCSSFRVSTPEEIASRRGPTASWATLHPPHGKLPAPSPLVTPANS